MATLGTRLFTWMYGTYAGEDEFGNRYYEERFTPRQRHRRRWVVYKGMAEPSKVPGHWHGWLHYTADTLPDAGNAKQHDWQQPHLPNLTGTPHTYLPPGHLLRGGKRAPTTSDYEPWQP